ncbi:MAG: cytochrome P450 [Pseudomonadaceae bacterium]|nr:cytochrome P450 [Pseudomonadaceae bacterium]
MNDESSGKPIAGLNGVAITKPTTATGAPAYRTFEVYQRQRPHQSTELINGAQLIAPAMLADPYPTLTVLRENYPCYRDWINNAFWLTRYDDVTSVFTDDANFESRSNAWRYGDDFPGNNLIDQPAMLAAYSSAFDAGAEKVIQRLIDELPDAPDLAIDFAAKLPGYVLGQAIGLPSDHYDRLCSLLWHIQRGLAWLPANKMTGMSARTELTHLLTEYWAVGSDADDPAANMISATASVGGTPEDLATTIIELDQQTLHGLLANLWFHLLREPAHLTRVASDQGLLKIAVLETLRHSPAVLSAHRFARHEVERFGCLIPEGALVICSSAAANRDPRVFAEPETFVIDRSDICHREPRGQYRADGLASGMAVALGPPSKHPAVPEDRPRSSYALVRDTAVRASLALLERLPGLLLASDEPATMRSLSVGEMYTCWRLPIRFDRKQAS